MVKTNLIKKRKKKKTKKKKNNNNTVSMQQFELLYAGQVCLYPPSGGCPDK